MTQAHAKVKKTFALFHIFGDLADNCLVTFVMVALR
jgi:hypothetical protein